MEKYFELEPSESVEQFIARQVESGRYESRTALIEAAIRRLQEHEAELRYVVTQIHEPWEQWQRGTPGKTIDLESLFERVDKRIDVFGKSGE